MSRKNPIIDRIVVRDQAGRIVGHVHPNCSGPNQTCSLLAREGRRYHAIPRGFAATLPTYHYRTLIAAVRALQTLAKAEGVAEPPTTGELMVLFPDETRRNADWAKRTPDRMSDISDCTGDPPPALCRCVRCGTILPSLCDPCAQIEEDDHAR